MPLETKPWDPAEYLNSPEDVAAYLEAVLEDGDPAAIARALGAIARARGMSEVAREAGVNRAALYRALSEGGDPRLSTVIAVARALGLNLSLKPAA